MPKKARNEIQGSEFLLQFGTGTRANRRPDDISCLLQEQVRLNVAAHPQRDYCCTGQGACRGRLCEDRCQPGQYRGQEIGCQPSITNRSRERSGLEDVTGKLQG